MSVFAKATASPSRSKRTLLSGLAIVGASALVLAGCATDGGETPSGNDGGDLTLKLGTALPVTGNLAFLGPPEIAGTEYAASLINEADAGITVDLIQGDSGDTDNKAYETEIPRLLGEDVSAILGAASSGVSLQFIDQVVGAGVIQFSPANTSAAFTDYDDKGLYFRTAPSDVLQGEVLGNLFSMTPTEPALPSSRRKHSKQPVVRLFLSPPTTPVTPRSMLRSPKFLLRTLTPSR